MAKVNAPTAAFAAIMGRPGEPARHVVWPTGDAISGLSPEGCKTFFKAAEFVAG